MTASDLSSSAAFSGAENFPFAASTTWRTPWLRRLRRYSRGRRLDGIAAGLANFPGVEHRLEFVRERNGVTYYNDSKATNVDATEKAIDAFPGNLWIILGGKDKNSDYTVLREKLRAKGQENFADRRGGPEDRGPITGLPLVDAGDSDQAVERAAP